MTHKDRVEKLMSDAREATNDANAAKIAAEKAEISTRAVLANLTTLHDFDKLGDSDKLDRVKTVEGALDSIARGFNTEGMSDSDRTHFDALTALAKSVLTVLTSDDKLRSDCVALSLLDCAKHADESRGGY